MKILELVIDEEAEVYGIDAISLVEFPAIESDFVALKNQQRIEFAEVDKEKRIVLGPALIPDKPIYRKNDDGEEFYVYFSKATVRKAMEMFMSFGNQNNMTLEHEHNIRGLSVVESWLVEDDEHDKSKKYGLDVPKGTWMVSIKVNNEAIWNEYVKSGKVKGFSIEGFFADKLDVENRKKKKDNYESFADYPDAVKNNARRGIELNEKVDNKCATQTGKVRAQQLAQGEAVSVETIKRMISFLSRAETYYDPNDTKACGTISYLLWGGKAGLRWAKSKMKELEVLSAIEIEAGLDLLESELAKIGPRGGVKRSKKAPKSGTPNPNPKGKGTARGTAKDTRSAKVSKKDEKTLQKKSDEFNERYKKKLGYGVTVGMLKAVFQRGLGAFNVSHSPKIKSATAWAQARVNAFLYLVKNGRPQNKKYTGDFDLLPKKHPKSKKK
jgi:hypothetical protein